MVDHESSLGKAENREGEKEKSCSPMQHRRGIWRRVPASKSWVSCKRAYLSSYVRPTEEFITKMSSPIHPQWREGSISIYLFQSYKKYALCWFNVFTLQASAQEPSFFPPPSSLPRLNWSSPASVKKEGVKKNPFPVPLFAWHLFNHGQTKQHASPTFPSPGKPGREELQWSKYTVLLFVNYTPSAPDW